MKSKKYSIEVLGTVVTLTLPHRVPLSLINTCFDELKRIEKKFTRFNSKSKLMILNSHLFTWQHIDLEFYNLLIFAQKIKIKTNGFFDISQKHTLEKFGYGKKYSNPFIFQLLSFLYSKNYSLKKNEVKLYKEIEIGGFGKGYALERLKIILDNHTIEHYILNMGGDIYVRGMEEVYLESPYNNENLFAKLRITNTSLCSSSSSRRKFNGKHHLINPKTKTSEEELLQVFIEHEDPMMCDALSTALFVMGFNKAKSYAIHNKLSVCIIGKDELYTNLNLEYI